MTPIRSTDVESAVLPEVRMSTSRHPGYAVDAVDDQLDACQKALESWERGEPATLTAADVVAVRLPKGAGYSADAVDDLLDAITAQLNTYERDAARGRTVDDVTTPAVAAPPVEPIRSHELTTERLPRRRVGGRYAIDEVDAFVDEVSAALSNVERRRPAGLHSDEIVHREFTTVSLFGLGYDADAVDDLLDRAAMQLRVSEPKSRLQVEEEQRQEAQLRGMLEDVQKRVRKNGSR
jgi:DivIVA domain-containing protein